MAPVDIAIKDLFKEELQDIRDFQAKQDQRFNELEKALQSLSAQVEERKQETAAVKEDVDKLRTDHDALDERVKIIEALDPTGLKDRVDRLESDEDGIGGLKQVHEKLEGIQDLQTKFAEVSRIASGAKTRTDELDLLLKQFLKNHDDLQAFSKRMDERLKKVELSSGSVSLAQQALEDATARKYETMWKDVLNAMEEMKSSWLDEHKKELERARENSRTNAKGMVSYALNMMGAAHSERKKLEVGKDLMTAWKHQTWASIRRKQGLWRLHNLFQRRKRATVNRWARAAAIANLSDNLRKDTAAMIPDVHLAIADSGLLNRCTALDVSLQDLRKLTETKVTGPEVEKALQEGVGILEALCRERYCTNELHQTELGQVRDESKEAANKIEASINAKIEVCMESSDGLDEKLAMFAKNVDLQGMMRDGLHTWNSLKQLDSVKADKKDVDAFMTACIERDNNSSKRMENISPELVEQLKQEISGLQARWFSMEATVNDSFKQVNHWETMWEKLAGYVEDLVTKVSDLQVQANSAVAGGHISNKLSHGVSITRAPSGGPGRNRPPSVPVQMQNLSGIDLETSVDTLPMGGNMPGMARGSVPADSAMDPRMIWAGSAKGLVDQTMQSGSAHAAATTSTPKLRPLSASRPQAAKGQRKSVDRA